MFIIWGTKVRRRPMRRRADFCPICRRIRPFKVEQIESVPHLYYIPYGSGTVHGHIKSCQRCGLDVDADLDDALDVSQNPVDDVTELIANNRAAIEKRWSSRLEIEERVKSRRLTAAERESLILEPFVLTNPALQQRASQLYFDKLSGLCCLATFVVPMAVLILGTGVFHISLELVEKIVLVLAVLLGCCTIAAIVTDRARFTRREIIPKLATALFPLSPSPDEIDGVLARLKKMGWQIGKKAKTEDITTAIQCHLPVD